MGKSRIRYDYDRHEPEDIADEEITHVRIYKDDGEWWMDGVDDNGNYSTSCWSYDTWDDAIADAPDFLTTFTQLTERGVTDDDA